MGGLHFSEEKKPRRRNGERNRGEVGKGLEGEERLAVEVGGSTERADWKRGPFGVRYKPGASETPRNLQG